MKSGISWNEVQELFSSVRYVSIATVDKHDTYVREFDVLNIEPVELGRMNS